MNWVFLSALAIFELGSIVCGATPTSLGLILGRVLAGFGSGGLFAGVSFRRVFGFRTVALFNISLISVAGSSRYRKQRTSGEAANLQWGVWSDVRNCERRWTFVSNIDSKRAEPY